MTAVIANSRPGPGQIPLHRVSLLHPFVQFLDEIGAPVERELQRAGLPSSVCDDLSNYVPSDRFWSFLFNISFREGIDNIGFRVGERFGAACADPGMAEVLRHDGPLFQGLLTGRNLMNRTVSKTVVEIHDPPDQPYIYYCHRPACNMRNPVMEQISWFGLEILIDVVRIYAGPKWIPREIGLVIPQTPDRTIDDSLSHCHIRRSKSYNYIAIEETLLGTTPRAAQGAIPGPITAELQSYPGRDFVGSLKQVLQTYVFDKRLDIDYAAALAGLSRRSLQRSLEQDGTSFSELLAEVRLNTALRMLERPGISVTEISKRLGYTHATHFSRAFRRMVGVSPMTYRRNQLKFASGVGSQGNKPTPPST